MHLPLKKGRIMNKKVKEQKIKKYQKNKNRKSINYKNRKIEKEKYSFNSINLIIKILKNKFTNNKK